MMMEVVAVVLIPPYLKFYRGREKREERREKREETENKTETNERKKERKKAIELLLEMEGFIDSYKRLIAKLKKKYYILLIRFCALLLVDDEDHI